MHARWSVLHLCGIMNTHDTYTGLVEDAGCRRLRGTLENGAAHLREAFVWRFALKLAMLALLAHFSFNP